MAIKLMGHAWISGKDTIGVILVHDDVTNKHSGRIAVVTGVNQEIDLQWVQDRGSLIPLSAAVILIDDGGIWADRPPVEVVTKASF